MLIKEIEISGFRGIRKKLTIPFGSGFTVITGRNGSGKTSVCDAIEYLFTQKITRVSAEQAEGGERLEDYIWWRGKQRAPANSITGRLEDSGIVHEAWSVGKLGKEGRVPDEILFDKQIAPRDPLPALCRTSILRDELITWLSTDLAEGARAEFVEQAIGIVGTTQLENTAGNYVARFKERLKPIEGEYNLLREKISGILEEISETQNQATVADEESLRQWTETAAKLVGIQSTEVPKLLSGLATKIAATRGRADQLERLSIDLKAHEEEISKAAELLRQQELLRAEMTKLEATLKSAEADLEVASKNLKSANEAQPIYTSLAALREHGLRVGLQDGKCPLCGTRLTEETYHEHLQTIAEEVNQHQLGLDALVKKESDLQTITSQLRTSIETTRNQFNRYAADHQVFEKTQADMQERAKSAGVNISEDEVKTKFGIEKANLAELEKCSDALKGFAVSERVKDLLKKKSLAELDAEEVKKQSETVNEALQGVSTIFNEIRRVSREALEERLASLNPLLSELYARLKPHVDFAEIKYRMRGDVKRLLRLEVGDGFNPRFTFSSGQRRALGLAFLFAVYLSRRWCKLNTLILDDPMQHVDDYRALHLVEVLSSIRQSGHQVICTVEDPALADLLCRRLRSSDKSSGVRVELAYRPGSGVEVKDLSTVAPLPSRVLTAA
jgi:DNA repair exonuclease SbcCD ATPase subunit